MATFHLPIICDNTTGSTNFKVRYRLMGDSLWTSLLITPSSGTTLVIPQDSPTHVLLNNRIYDFQVQNLNGAGNDLSLIAQQMGLIFETDPTISPTSVSVGYSFDNLSVDIDSYTIQLTTLAEPGTVIATTTVDAGEFPNVIEGTFNDLEPALGYRLVITPVANQFSKAFVFIFNTESTGICPAPTDVTAAISN